MAERAGQLGVPRSAWRCRIVVVECAVGQGGRSARWPASSASPGPDFQRHLLWLSAIPVTLWAVVCARKASG